MSSIDSEKHTYLRGWSGSVVPYKIEWHMKGSGGSYIVEVGRPDFFYVDNDDLIREVLPNSGL
jgi:hypothetical protein